MTPHYNNTTSGAQADAVDSSATRRHHLVQLMKNLSQLQLGLSSAHDSCTLACNLLNDAPIICAGDKSTGKDRDLVAWELRAAVLC